MWLAVSEVLQGNETLLLRYLIIIKRMLSNIMYDQ